MRITSSAPHSAHAARIAGCPPGAETTTSWTPAARMRTAATISATIPLTDAPPGAIARTRPANVAASGASAAVSRSAGTQALHDVVDRRGLELVGDRVGDEPGSRRRDLLAHG